MGCFRFAGLSSLLLITACATPDAHGVTRGAPCDKIGQTSYDDKGAIFICAEALTGDCKTRGVWGLIGIDQPISGVTTPNTECPKLGELTRADDGSILVCAEDPTDTTPNNKTEDNHAHH